MIRVLHLIDDARLGGITRTLDAQHGTLGADIAAERLVVNPDHPVVPALGRADIVIVHFTLAWRKLPFLAALRLACRGRKLVLVEHSYTAAYEQCRVRHRGRFRLMLQLGMALFDQVVAVSHGQAGWLRDAGLVPAGKLTVIEPTSDVSAFAAVPALVPRTGPLKLGCYGRYAPQKGLFDLVEAMRLLPAGTAELRLAGYGPDEEPLRAAAEGIAGVSIEGPTATPERFVAEIDAIIMPSRWEAFGQVCAEARAAGRPVLVADVDGLPEQVPPELRMASGSPVDIADRIRWLAAQDLREIGEALRPEALTSGTRHFAAWTGLIRSLTATQSLPAGNPQGVRAH